MEEFQKYSPVWKYFSGSSYDMELLKDFGFISSEQYKWFCLFVCRNKNIDSVKENFRMSLPDFKRREFFLLDKPSLFDLLEKMILPLQMKRFQLDLGLDKGFYNAPISCRNLAEFFKSDTFSKDSYARWNYYFTMVAQTINDLRTCFDSKFDIPEFENVQKTEKQNLIHAAMLEMEFKKALSAVPEYIWEKDVIWSASDNQVVPLFLRFSSLFDFSSERLSEMAFLQTEERMLNVVEKAIIFCETNDIQGKEKAFTNISDAKEQIQKLNAEMKVRSFHRHLSKIWQERQEGISHEKE